MQEIKGLKMERDEDGRWHVVIEKAEGCLDGWGDHEGRARFIGTSLAFWRMHCTAAPPGMCLLFPWLLWDSGHMIVPG